MSGYDQRGQYLRAGPTKDLEFCRFVDEDFRGIALDTNNWRTQIAAAGSTSLLDDTASGVFRLTTDAGIGDDVILDRNNIRIADPSLKPLLCIRAKVSAITDIEIRLGLVDVHDTDHCVFEVDVSAHGNSSIYAEAYSGGVQNETVDTGIDLDTNWHIYEILIGSDGTPEWTIDGTVENTGDAADVDPAEFFQPYAEVESEAVAAKSLDLDFIKGLQRRA